MTATHQRPLHISCLYIHAITYNIHLYISIYQPTQYTYKVIYICTYTYNIFIHAYTYIYKCTCIIYAYMYSRPLCILSSWASKTHVLMLLSCSWYHYLTTWVIGMAISCSSLKICRVLFLWNGMQWKIFCRWCDQNICHDCEALILLRGS